MAADLTFLTSVINWACRWQDPATGRYLMKENPARGFELPTEKNPRRPVATQDRFEKVRAAAEEVEIVVGRGKARRSVRSYLPEILDIVNGTGRRISAVLALKYQDLRLDQGVYGAIRWPADTDKMEKEWLVPSAKKVRKAIDQILVAGAAAGG